MFALGPLGRPLSRSLCLCSPFVMFVLEHALKVLSPTYAPWYVFGHAHLLLPPLCTLVLVLGPAQMFLSPLLVRCFVWLPSSFSVLRILSPFAFACLLLCLMEHAPRPLSPKHALCFVLEHTRKLLLLSTHSASLWSTHLFFPQMFTRSLICVLCSFPFFFAHTLLLLSPMHALCLVLGHAHKLLAHTHALCYLLRHSPYHS